MMWLGDPSVASVSNSSAFGVEGHQSSATLSLGKRFFSSINLPLESIRSAMSSWSVVLLSALFLSWTLGSRCACWLGGDCCEPVGVEGGGGFCELVEVEVEGGG